MSTLLTKLQAVRQELNQVLLERETAVEAVLGNLAPGRAPKDQVARLEAQLRQPSHDGGGASQGPPGVAWTLDSQDGGTIHPPLSGSR